jgi:Domain of unknown function (DUF4276)
VTVKIYVEGGGDHNKDLQTECRRGFSEFFRRAGLEGRMPRVVACGGRQRAYDSFRTAHLNAEAGSLALLLVDSEAPVVEHDPWEHIKLRPGDGWPAPDGATQDQIHLMAQAMEAWFLADKEELQRYYGQGFRPAALRQRPDVENIPKADLFAGLQQATRNSQKGEYSKGRDSFEILARIDPAMVKAAALHAKRLLHVLDQVC